MKMMRCYAEDELLRDSFYGSIYGRDKRSFYIYVYYTIDGIDLVF
jgi:hypothetical protein